MIKGIAVFLYFSVGCGVSYFLIQGQVPESGVVKHDGLGTGKLLGLRRISEWRVKLKLKKALESLGKEESIRVANQAASDLGIEWYGGISIVFNAIASDVEGHLEILVVKMTMNTMLFANGFRNTKLEKVGGRAEDSQIHLAQLPIQLLKKLLALG